MKMPLSWLNDYMDIKVEPKEYCDRMTMSGSKVEGFTKMGEDIENVKIGKIVAIAPHTNSDHLQICQLDMGSEVLQIVTGAPNVFVGAIVPVALNGAKLPGGIVIKKTKMRGEESNGMLCSHDELGLDFEDVEGANKDGIICFTKEIEPGTDVKDVLGLNETIIEFEITSNRPDCLCVNGLALETAATFGLSYTIPEVSIKNESGSIIDYVKVNIEEPQLCPRYIARAVKNVVIQESPKWMKDRLVAAGMRPINNIVDITNYVLIEYGQPMHAFDTGFIEGGEINVRRAKDGEMIKTLDGQDRVLNKDMLVIADKNKAVGIAGVMGGFNSEIANDTKTILFESANFNGANIRRTAVALGLRTEASARFEKGLDANNTITAINRACQLVELLGAGEIVAGMIDIDNSPKEPVVLPFDPDRINRFLGMDISRKFMEDALTSLKFTVNGDSVIVPTFRKDVEGMADIAEEVMRIYGYDKIEATPMRGATTVGTKTLKQKLEDKVLDTLSAQGYYQIMTYSFTSPKLLKAVGEDESKVIKIINPLGEENSVMRNSILSSILEVCGTNYKYRNENVRIFELGTIYLADLPLTKLPEEKQKLAIAGYGKMDYFDLKGAVEELFETLGIYDYSFERGEDKAFHPGKCAKIMINNVEAGIMGEVHPDVSDAFEIETNVYAAELDFEVILKTASFEHEHKGIAKFPAVTRDIAVIVDENILVSSIADIIKKCSGKLLEDLQLFDVYKGEQIPKGKQSVAYSAIYRANDRTLKDDDINKFMNKIVKLLDIELGAQLR